MENIEAASLPKKTIAQIGLSIAASTIGTNAMIRRLRDVFVEFSEIESMILVAGGDPGEIQDEAKELARTTVMNYKQAVVLILAERERSRIEPIGLLDNDALNKALKTHDSDD